MPLVAANLSALMRGKIVATPAIGAIDGPALTALCDKISEAVVEYIVANAVVNTVVSTTGTAAAQTGTGVGTVT
jgi:hypothetical protein